MFAMSQCHFHYSVRTLLPEVDTSITRGHSDVVGPADMMKKFHALVAFHQSLDILVNVVYDFTKCGPFVTHEIKVKKVKECIAVTGTPSHSYGTLLAIWNHTVFTWHPTQVNASALPQPVNRYSIYLPMVDGRLS